MGFKKMYEDRNIEILNSFSVNQLLAEKNNKVFDASTLERSTGVVTPRVQIGDSTTGMIMVCMSRKLKESGETAESFVSNRTDRQVLLLRDYDHLDNNGKPREWYCGCTAGEYINIGGKSLAHLL